MILLHSSEKHSILEFYDSSPNGIRFVAISKTDITEHITQLLLKKHL